MNGQQMYSALDSLVVRTPLLTQNSAKNLNLDHILCDTRIMTSLAVASPSLYKQLIRDKRDTDTQLSVLKYLKRMALRPTPYGLLAGVALAKFDERTKLTRTEKVSSSTRPDMSLLMDIVVKLERDMEVRKRLTLFPNPELIVKADRIWIEHPLFPHQGIKNGLSIPADRAVLRVINLVSEGCLFQTLCNILAYDFQEQVGRAEELVNQLCDSGVLLSHLRFSLDDSANLLTNIREFCELPTVEPIYKQLERLLDSMAVWDATTEKSADSYMKLLKEASDITSALNTVQVDSAFDVGSAKVSHLIAQEAASAAELLLSLSRSRYSGALSDYKKAFNKRYQLRREIPILELLSPTFGLGPPSYDYRLSTDTGERNRKLLELATIASNGKSLEVNLSKDDLKILQLWQPNVKEAPLSLDLFVSVATHSPDTLDRGDFSLVLSPRGGEVGAGRALGRFHHVLGAEVNEVLQEIVSIENQASSGLQADVCFWTEKPRHANVTSAPLMRDYVITANCAPVPNRKNIPLSELMIGLEDDRFYARWIRTGEKIVACPNSMLNKSLMPEAIRFLITIATDGQPKLESFDWGPAASLSFLPRVRYGKFVLRLASWDLKGLQTSFEAKSDQNFALRVREWRKHSNMPAQIQIANSPYTDNLLFLDLDDVLDLELLEQMVRKGTNSQLIAYEHMPGGEWNKSIQSDSSYTTEFVISLLRTDLKSRTSDNQLSPQTNSPMVSQRDYLRPPGSEWLYLRLDCNSNTHEEIIAKSSVIANKLVSDDLIKQWFFVRYADPQDHIRLRFRVNVGELYTKTMPMLCQWSTQLVETGLCSRFSVDTYDREVERYGGVASMDIIEQIFSLDSEVVSEIFKIPGLNELDRNVVGILSINSFLTPFKPLAIERYEWLKNAQPNYKMQGSDDYRLIKPLLSDLLSKQQIPADSSYAPILAVLTKYNHELQRLANQLQEFQRFGQLTAEVDTLLDSLVHMHCNRFFGLNRSTERLVMSLSTRTVESIVKRGERMAVFDKELSLPRR
ncbi:MAG: lantibiotic dehydratase [Cyanobacteria bacterium SZAS-4]|nr:lantibiotic dehydratase [Cyanobacteria bacterium SZAS-4]